MGNLKSFDDSKTGFTAYTRRRRPGRATQTTAISDNLRHRIATLDKEKDATLWIEGFNRLTEDVKLCRWNQNSKSFEIQVHEAKTLQHVLSKCNVIQTSFQRNGTLFGYDISYKHHRVLMKTSGLTYVEYESTGDFQNLPRGEPIAHFKTYDRGVDELQNEDLYDFKKGVYIVMYPEMLEIGESDVCKIKERAEICRTKLNTYYYLFSSLNCENIATYILTGQGFSNQLDDMGVGMWLFCDIFDNFCYYRYILTLFQYFLYKDMCTILFLDFIILLMICFDCSKHTNSKVMESKHCRRQQMKYVLSFMIRVFMFCLGYNLLVLHLLSFILVPAVLGFMYNAIVFDKTFVPNIFVPEKFHICISIGG